MECQTCDSKKLFKVFDASKRKRARKKREGLDDTDNSFVTDDSNSVSQGNLAHNMMSHKASVQEIPTSETVQGNQNGDTAARGSSTTIRREEHRSPRRHRRSMRDSLSLALKSGIVSTPRSITPPPDGDGRTESPVQEQDSLIYAFLEEAIKRDKKKQRHRRHEEHRSRERESSALREHRHRHRRRRDDVPSRDRDKHRKDCSVSPTPAIDQTVLLETFAKLCAQINEKTPKCPEVKCTHSHKSLQCESSSRRDLYNTQHRPEQTYHELEPTRIRSQENCQAYNTRCKHDRHDMHHRHERRERHDDPPESPYYEEQAKYPSKMAFNKEPKYPSKMDFDRQPKYSSKMDFNKEQKYNSKIDVACSRHREEFHNYPPEAVATKTCLDHYRERPRERDYHDYDRRTYEEDRRRCCEQKTSRSFDEHRNFEEERCRRSSRSDKNKYYDKSIDAQERHIINKERRLRRTSDRFDKGSIASREEFRERDRYSERERDSGLSVADGETSTISGRSSYLRAVKQEIAEQREAMDKMMNLWKDLMRCFKGISQTQSKDNKSLNESACENVRESAAAQLRLWRECMRRYETVARDVGDTDARLMEEINKQRSEMTEMANMWQECLQRYRDMSNDFNTLKQKLVSSESPTRAPAPVCAEGEGVPTAPPYRLPPNYPMPASLNPSMYPMVGGTALRGRASAPPAWWWGGGVGGGGGGADTPCPYRNSSRHSSPDSRDRETDSRRDDRDRDRERDRRHRHKDSRDEPRYKEKSSKAGAPRSDHRRRKR